MLGLDNPIHLAFILILLLLVFGAKRLPEMGRSLGAGLRGFKESISGDEPPSTLTVHTCRPSVCRPACLGDRAERPSRSSRLSASPLAQPSSRRARATWTT